MSSDKNITINKKSTIQIEHVDESWALKLLNESEKEDYDSKVEQGLNPQTKELDLISSIQIEETPEDKVDEMTDVTQDSNLEEFSLRLSAIENQIFTQSQKQLEQNNSESKKTLSSPISRLKSFFDA